MASAVLKISRLGVYRTTDPRQLIITSPGGSRNQSVAYRIFHDNASHPNEDPRDRHGEESAMEISAPKMVQDTLRKGET